MGDLVEQTDGQVDGGLQVGGVDAVEDVVTELLGQTSGHALLGELLVVRAWSIEILTGLSEPGQQQNGLLGTPPVRSCSEVLGAVRSGRYQW